MLSRDASHRPPETAPGESPADFYNRRKKFDIAFTPAAISLSGPCATLLGTVDSLSSSMLFWMLIAAAFIATELGVTLTLVWLSARPMRSEN